MNLVSFALRRPIMSAIPDFIYPDTTGERPKDLEDRLNLQRGLGRLAVRDTAVFELLTEVRHLLKPPGLLNDPLSSAESREEIPPASELLFFKCGVEHEYS